MKGVDVRYLQFEEEGEEGVISIYPRGDKAEGFLPLSYDWAGYRLSFKVQKIWCP